jgi:UPF0716 protein FxsA
MLRYFIIGLAALVIVELFVLISVGQIIGAGWTIALVLLTAAVGASLAQREGIQSFNKVRMQLKEGSPPGDAILDTVSVFLGGVLLLLPGFLTDVCGILLIWPLSRKALREGVKIKLKNSLSRRNRLR